MAGPINRAALLALAAGKLPGGNRATAQDVLDVFTSFAESLLAIIDDKNAVSGYAGLTGGKLATSVLPEYTGEQKFNGDGVTKDFVVPHTLGSIASFISITPITKDAAPVCWIAGSTNADFTIRFDIAPPAGAQNVVFNWLVKK